jgi:exopolysaccharide biosynthesis protein
VTADGQTLYLLVIDGRQPDYSLGATTGEVGQWLASLGAAEGLNLDGGGTTTLVIAEKTGFKLINRPIHAGKPGTERVSASHLGLYAPPLPPTP